MSDVLVTCGVTAFNAVDTIERAIGSALAQHHRPIEIVVVDDASTDATSSILARLAAQHSEIRVYRQENNGGVAASRNRIIQEARGEFIAFFDDDDESLPKRLSIQLKRILDYEQAFAASAPIICHAARLIHYPSGQKQVWRAMGELEGRPAPAGPAVARAILGVGLPPRGGQSGAAATCSQMARRSLYQNLGGFDIEFRRSEDDDIAIRAALSGTHFIGVADPLVVQTLTATSDKGLANQRIYAIKLLAKHRKFLEENGSYRYALNYHDARFALMASRYSEFAGRIAWLVLTGPWATLSRLFLAMRNIGLHRRMGQFYLRKGK